MKVAYMLSGVPGCGKSTYAKKHFSTPNYTILESDAIRLSLFGTLDERVQNSECHAKVFSTMYQLAAKAKNDIVIDSANLSRKSRIFMYTQLKKHCSKVYLIQFIEPLSVVLQRNNSREPHKRIPVKTMYDMYKSFQPAKPGLDCDELEIIATVPFLKSPFSILDFATLAKSDGIINAIKTMVSKEYQLELQHINSPHDSVHHLESVDAHINMCLEASNKPVLTIIAAMHDLGKAVTKNGPHFYNHENVSASYAMSAAFANRLVVPQDLLNLDTIDAILYHMLSHQGLSTSTISKYQISRVTQELLKSFAEIDNKSRIKGEIKNE